MKLRAADLFSGCGGLSTGLEKAGFEVLAGVELRENARKVYLDNHPGTILFKDIRKITAEEILEKIGINRGDLDLLAGCPPCQGFSTMRTKNKLEPAEDDRNELIFDFVRMVKGIFPKVVLIENVPGLFHNWRLKEATSQLEEMGY